MKSNPETAFRRLLYAVAAVLGALAAAASPAAAASLEAKLTGDNAYQLWLGDASGVTALVGQAENCTAGQIFNGVETFTVADTGGATYLYLVAYSDDGGSQGVLGQLASGGTTLYTGDPAWQVFATGIDLDSCIGTPFPQAGAVNGQIAIANAVNGNPVSTSGTWVGAATTPLGNLAVGEDNSSAGGVFQLVPALDPQARWMWFDAPGPGNPFTVPNQREALIFRIPIAVIAPTCVPPPYNLVGWWPLDETAGTAAADVAANNHGTHHNGPLPVPGRVAGALSFDGANDFVHVPDSQLLDIGTSDFTVDAWVFTDVDTLIRPIVDKMDLAGGGAGYSLSLVVGNVMTFAWGDQSGFTFTHSSSGTPVGDPAVPVGQWTHVAVTLDRDSPTGGRFYIDGALVNTFDPSFKQGSFASSAPLRIGAGGIFNNGFFNGAIDEVEIFARALSADEIRGLYEAGGYGKCKDRLVPGWDYSICLGGTGTTASPQVCNDSTEPHTYDLLFSTVVGGVPGTGCSGQGPGSFTVLPPTSLPLLVPPRACRTVPVEVGAPPGIAPGQQRCFRVLALNRDTGGAVQAVSSVYGGSNFCAEVADPGIGLPPFEPRQLEFLVRNEAAAPATLTYQIEAMSSDMNPANVVVSLDGSARGEPVEGEVVVPARRSATVAVTAELSEFQALNTQDVLLRDLGTGNVLASVALAPVATGCAPGPVTLCLNGGRFRVEATWRDFAGNAGLGQAVPLTGDTGYFWFFSPSNVEVVLKVLDGRALNDHFWVFYGALSTVEYVITVTDTATGNSKTFFNPSGNLASVADTSALPGGSSAAAASAVPVTVAAAHVPLPEPGSAGACSPSATALCLNGGRFRVEVAWEDFAGNTGVGQAVPLSGDTGYFWFFAPTNVELILKVLDGRALNQHFWVFFGALSSVEYSITVTDTETGSQKTYFNASGNLGSVADTAAFPE